MARLRWLDGQTEQILSKKNKTACVRSRRDPWTAARIDVDVRGGSYEKVGVESDSEVRSTQVCRYVLLPVVRGPWLYLERVRCRKVG